MNDFTKDELKIFHILVARSLRCEPLSQESSIEFAKLIHKVESMIDNYCEHQWKTNAAPRGFESWNKTECINCGAIKK